MEVLHSIVLVFFAIFSLAYFLLRRHYSYWADCGVVHDKPLLFYGNLKNVGRTIPLHKPIGDFYRKYKSQASFGGFYFYVQRAVILFDLDLIKTVLIKDFAKFPHRGIFYNEKDEPLSGHLVNLAGPKWRKLRSKLTPTFTSGKMKFMFSTMVEVAERFVHILLEKQQQQKSASVEFSVEIKDLLARFTTDVIGSCAFGLECNSLRDPQTQFRVMGRRIFTEQRHGRILQIFEQTFPELARRLHMKKYSDYVNEFFMRIVRETVDYREKENVKRNDFMNLLLELKKSKEIDHLTMEELSAQAFVFFLAGFETSSSAMGFCLYELALNQHIQDKARAEINEMLQRHEGQFTYEGVRELKYLQQIFNETLRLYSIVSSLRRISIEDYTIPNTNHTLKAGTVVIVPVDAIHKDPDIYPEPEKFDPERFSPSEIEQRHSMSWLPFGEGPRNCIGLRFGEMQALIGLAFLLKNFRFLPTNETPIPLKIKTNSLLLASEGGIVLKLEKMQ